MRLMSDLMFHRLNVWPEQNQHKDIFVAKKQFSPFHSFDPRIDCICGGVHLGHQFRGDQICFEHAAAFAFGLSQIWFGICARCFFRAQTQSDIPQFTGLWAVHWGWTIWSFVFRD